MFRRGKIISNLDLIIDCADKLLAKWRASPTEQVHLDMTQQCQNLLLAVFGLIAFDYDLETLDGDGSCVKNELNQALHDYLSTLQITMYAPGPLATIYLKLSSRHRRSHAVIEQHLYRMIEQELGESSESSAHRKRTSLIASLVSSLQNDEKVEEAKSEEERKGKIIS